MLWLKLHTKKQSRYKKLKHERITYYYANRRNLIKDCVS